MRGAVALVLVTTAAWPQSLAEVAAREKERQAKAKKSERRVAHIYTEDDLRSHGAGTYSRPGTSAAPESPSASPSPAVSPRVARMTLEELRAEQEKAWRVRLQEAEEDVVLFSGDVDRLQTALNDTWNYRLYSPERTQLLHAMDQAQKRLAAAKQKVADVQEQGRWSEFR